MYTPAPQQYQPVETAQLQAVPQPQDKPKAPAKSKGSNDVGAFIQQCISLCSYLKELETQAHLCHLNYEGGNFLGVHAFLKEQYEAHLAQFDALGEFIRSMDFYTPMCSKGWLMRGQVSSMLLAIKEPTCLGCTTKILRSLV
jgi:hypothetical protein